MNPDELINPICKSKNKQAAHAQHYWALANSYFTAADQLLEKPSGQAFVPTLFLLAHSLELFFKTFLIYRGIPEKALEIKLRHNLELCFRKCNEQGLCKYLVLSQIQVRQIATVNRYYQKKHLEYYYGCAMCFGSIENFKYIVCHVSKCILDLITREVFLTLPKVT